jgi:hypothetical protein
MNADRTSREVVGSGIRRLRGPPGDGGHQDQLVDPLGVSERQLLGDHAAKTGTNHAGSLDAGVVRTARTSWAITRAE